MPPSSIYRHTLGSGLQIVGETFPQMQSVSLGLWVGVGSSFESPSLCGVSHFIEHLVFKGTKRFGPVELTSCLEKAGGDINAFTDREATCYHTTTLRTEVEPALTILHELTVHPLFKAQDIALEKKILFQEMAMVEENLEEWGLDTLLGQIWKQSPMGLPILGTRGSIKKMGRAQILQFFKRHYQPSKMVLAFAGPVTGEEIKKYSNLLWGKSVPKKSAVVKFKPAPYRAVVRSVKKKSEQSHVFLGFKTQGMVDEWRSALYVLSYYLGGGMSSRLFQQVREKWGLAYSVEVDHLAFMQSGVFLFYAATKVGKVKKLVRVLLDEIEQLVKNPLSQSVVDDAKGQILGGMRLSMDNMESNQEVLGRSVVCGLSPQTLREASERIKKVSPAQIHQMSQKLFEIDQASLWVVGPQKTTSKELRAMLKESKTN